MITHMEASFNLSLSIERMFQFMRNHGVHYPVIFALNKGKPLDVEPCLNESVINHNNEDKDPAHPIYRVYRSAVGFRNYGPEDEENMQKAADSIAKKLDPDAIALIIACIYDEFDEGQNQPSELQLDPDAFNVLHTCYWLREDPKPWVSMVPYVCKPSDGPLTTPVTNPREDVNHGVVSTAFPWVNDPKKLGTKILDPYRDLRNAKS